MEQEFIIINKTAIEKRIKELKKTIDKYAILEARKDLYSKVDNLLSQSTPLIPEIEKAWKDGRDGTKVVGNFPFIGTNYINKTSQNYISNLKLDI